MFNEINEMEENERWNCFSSLGVEKYFSKKLKKEGFKFDSIKEVASVDMGPAGYEYIYSVLWIEKGKIKSLNFSQDLCCQFCFEN